jgi:ribose transport system permease protein
MQETEMSEVPVAVGTAPVRRTRVDRSRALLYRYAVVLVFGVMVAVFSSLLPPTFFTTGNFQTIVNSQAVLLLLSLALTLPLSVGEFDLSVASMLGFSATLLAFLSGNWHWSLLPALAAVVGVGALVGMVNALFVVRFGVNAFIVTLGTGTVLTGLTLAVSGGQILTGVPESVTNFSAGEAFGLVWPAYVALGCAVLLWYLYEQTPTGRYLFFVGEGREVARLAGLPVARLRWLAFVLAAVVAAICGIFAAGQLGSADPSVGPNYLLPAYAAAFLGATTIKPGRFNALGTVVALYLLVTGVTGLELLGAASWIEQVFNGSALVIAVTFARLVSREAAE